MKSLDAPLFASGSCAEQSRFRPFLLASCLGALFLSPLSAAEVSYAPAVNTLPASGSTLLAVVRLFGALAVVLAVFFAGVWVVRHWQRIALYQRRAPRLKVLERQSLGQRHSLYVVCYDQQRVLIATSPAGVTMLTPLSAAGVEEQPSPVSTAAPEATSFVQQLWGAMARQS